MAELVFFRRGEEVLRFALDASRVVLGRGEKCDVQLPDPEVSRQQVALTLVSGRCELEDLSGKGTVVAGQRLTRGEVPDGADIALGQWRAIFRASSAQGDLDTTESGNRTELVALAELTDAPRLSAQVRVRVGAQETVHRLQLESFTVGKDAGNDLVLNHRFVSGRHLKVTRRGNRFLVSDQQSTNGTWLNGVRLFEADLPFFTTLRLGEAELCLEPWGTGAAKGVGNYEGIIGNDPSIKQLAELVERVAPSSAAVAVFGESGTGKELVAHALHNRSTRSGGPFIPVNCAAISKELIESELFGHEKGAFTGAATTRKGAFEEADGGTLFLDEIGELPLDLQAKLLRALESGEVKRVGASKPLTVDVRIVAATNRDLLTATKAGRFREDLYYRLCVIPLHLAPLRSRPADLGAIAEHFLARFSPRGQPVRLMPDALEKLQRYAWPGNVRELRNVIHRALLLRRGSSIDAGDVSFDASAPATAPPEPTSTAEYQSGQTLEQMVDNYAKQVILSALKRFGNNRERVAKELSVGRSTLFKRLKDWGLTNLGETE